MKSHELLTRAPDPDWVKWTPDYRFPDPVLVEAPEPVPEWDEPDWLSVWVQVTDLLMAGPLLSDRLVTAAELDEHGEAHTLKYLHRRYPSIEQRTLTGRLDYPLGSAVGVEIPPFVTQFKTHESRSHMTVGWILWALARGYEQIYERPEHYGVWGHSIGVLGFERLAIEGDRVYVSVGS